MDVMIRCKNCKQVSCGEAISVPRTCPGDYKIKCLKCNTTEYYKPNEVSKFDECVIIPTHIWDFMMKEGGI